MIFLLPIITGANEILHVEIWLIVVRRGVPRPPAHPLPPSLPLAGTRGKMQSASRPPQVALLMRMLTLSPFRQKDGSVWSVSDSEICRRFFFILLNCAVSSMLHCEEGTRSCRKVLILIEGMIQVRVLQICYIFWYLPR